MENKPCHSTTYCVIGLTMESPNMKDETSNIIPWGQSPKHEKIKELFTPKLGICRKNNDLITSQKSLKWLNVGKMKAKK